MPESNKPINEFQLKFTSLVATVILEQIWRMVDRVCAVDESSKSLFYNQRANNKQIDPDVLVDRIT